MSNITRFTSENITAAKTKIHLVTGAEYIFTKTWWPSPHKTCFALSFRPSVSSLVFTNNDTQKSPVCLFNHQKNCAGIFRTVFIHCFDLLKTSPVWFHRSFIKVNDNCFVWMSLHKKFSTNKSLPLDILCQSPYFEIQLLAARRKHHMRRIESFGLWKPQQNACHFENKIFGSIMILNWLHIDWVMEVQLSCYLVLLSIDSKTR